MVKYLEIRMVSVGKIEIENQREIHGLNPYYKERFETSGPNFQIKGLEKDEQSK